MSEREVFTAALQQTDPRERAHYLDRACDGNAALRRRVEKLLRADARAGDLLSRPAIEQIALDVQGVKEVTIAFDSSTESTPCSSAPVYDTAHADEEPAPEGAVDLAA